jgi:hypothetical protein
VSPPTDEEVRAKSWAFNYSPEQWDTIQRLVEANCDLPFRHAHLLRMANLCLYHLKRLSDPSLGSPGSHAEPWLKAADQVEEICQLIGGQADYMDEIATKEGDKFGRALALREEIDKFRHILAQATDLRDELEGAASVVRTWSSKRDVRSTYFRNVLYCWWAAGGALRRSRPSSASESRQAGGPAVNYFDAAVRPVLGYDTPGPERVYQLIKEARDVIPKGSEQVWRELLSKQDIDKLWDSLLFWNVGNKRTPW